MYNPIRSKIVFVQRVLSQLIQFTVHRKECFSFSHRLIIPTNRFVGGATIIIHRTIWAMIDGEVISHFTKLPNHARPWYHSAKCSS